ncbi:hypothetical protein MNBD_IGNAVI01-2229 [hydrothermal vent metagenome]|uniref:Lipoyl-binding domain-containing protein n=1 Tax=hydrothermal vent metagenome TaxID=652676 RepID=A0A3B1C409_9ZZZZ
MNEIYAKVGNKKLEIQIISKNEILLNWKKYNITLNKLNNDLYQLSFENKQYQLYVKEIQSGHFQTVIEGEDHVIHMQTKLEAEANKLLKKNSNSNSNNKVTAPMNGLVVKVNKNVGEKVEIGESLIVLEAMKMENEIKSLSDGIVKTVNCLVGNSVDKGELLFIIE